jgi:hypothetical protein
MVSDTIKLKINKAKSTRRPRKRWMEDFEAGTEAKPKL